MGEEIQLVEMVFGKSGSSPKRGLSPFLAAILVALGMCVFAPSVSADESYTFVIQKQEQKAKNRWSLQDWLDTRDRMRMMDLWLAIHSPSPYEFYVSGLYAIGNLATGPQLEGWSIVAGGYATIFGLEYQRQVTDRAGERSLFLFNLRLWGYHDQSSNLTVSGGMNLETTSVPGLWNPVVGASATFYLAKPFGVTGLFRYRIPRDVGITTASRRWEVGAFIDFNFVRVLGTYFTETDDAGAAQSKSGFLAGVRLYF